MKGSEVKECSEGSEVRKKKKSDRRKEGSEGNDVT